MLCPKCQTNVPEGHFYCPNCRASVYNYAPDNSWSNGSILERAGRRLLDLLIILILIGGGVVLGRAIKWKELLNGFKPTTEASPAPKRDSHTGSPSKRHAASPSPTPQEKTDPTAKSPSAESARDLPQKIEELSKPDEIRRTRKPSPPPPQTTGD